MITKVVLVVLLGFSANALVLINDPLYCYSWDPIRPQIEMFDGTTPYGKVRGTVDPLVSKCTPSRFWYQGRHGARYPSVPDGDDLLSATDPINHNIVKNFKSLKTTLCLPDAKLIENWQINPNFLLSTPGNLTAAGWYELQNIAARMQKAFPTLLPKKYTPEHYFFRRSPILRTLQSAQAFADGLFGPEEYNLVNYEGGQSPDLFLYFFGSCPIWDTFYSSAVQVEVFQEGQYYQQMVKQVSAKLGFHGSQQLNSSEVDKLITHCKYEQILNLDKSAAFCSAFSIANHQVNEYNVDLEFYYLTGYGNPAYKQLYENMSCYLVQAMLQYLQSNDPSDQKAKLWFGHDVTLQFVFNALGLFEDAVPLTGSNFPQKVNRKWKTSYLTPMGANLAVIRYE